MRTRSTLLASAFVAATVGLAHPSQAAAAAQEKPPAPSAAPSEQPKALVGLKVQIVLSRFKGEKKISSLPYTLGVTANSGKTSLRLGVDVPVINRNPTPTTASYSYRSVGTNIDCSADTLFAPNNTYRLNIVVQDSSIHLETTQAGNPKPDTNSDLPAFRSFNSTFTILLRDGQTTEYTSAVDPVTGEVMKIDVTLTVLR